jgi:hypothetical protein
METKDLTRSTHYSEGGVETGAVGAKGTPA